MENDLTWKKIHRMSPMVRSIEHDIRFVKDDKSKVWFCANKIWYRDFKERVIAAAGWESRDPNPEMHTQQAYDIVYRHLYEMLPPCRDCICF